MTHSLVSRIVKAVNIAIALLLAAGCGPGLLVCVAAAAGALRLHRRAGGRAGHCELRYTRRAAHTRRQPGGRLFRAGLRDGAGPPVSDGRPAPLRGRLTGGGSGPPFAGQRSRIAQTAAAAHRRGRLRHAARDRPRGVRRLHSRRQPVHRHTPQQPSGGIHAARITSRGRGAWWIACCCACTCIAT